MWKPGRRFRMTSTQERSPQVLHVSWGRMEIAGVGQGKDFVLYPGGGHEWDWSLTGTRHNPGIQPADVAELIDRRCDVVVLSRGMELRLQVMPDTIRALESAGVEVRMAETSEAVNLYNDLVADHRVGGLFHSTC